MNESELREVAAQLACPSGECGVAIGEKMNEVNAAITRRSIAALSPKTGEWIVEIGPGNGILSLPIVEAIGPKGCYIGLERSIDMAAQALAILKNDEHAQIDIHVGNCLVAAIPENCMDGLMAVNVLYFIDDLDAFFAKIFTWLKPGARAVFGVRAQSTLEALPFARFGFHIRSLEAIIEKLNATGFAQVQSEYFVENKSGFNDAAMDFVVIETMRP